MRQYLLGVLILFCGLQVFCENANENEEHPNPFYVREIPGGIINGEDSSSASISEEERNFDIEDDVYSDEENAERKYADFFSGEDGARDYDSDVAYWESIYGKEDVPEFEHPPPIDGESIFIDVDDLTDSWEDQDDGETAIPVKRDTSRAAHGARSSSSVKLRRNFESSLKSGKSDYRSTMGDAHVGENQRLYGSEGSSKTSAYSNHERHESSWSSNNVRKSEIRKGRVAHSQDVDIETKTESDSAAHFSSGLESKSIKSSHASDALLDSKRRIIQAKKDLINVAASGGSKTEVSDAVHRTIEAKKDFIDSVVSAKVQRKKEFLNSAAAGFDHSHGHRLHANGESSGSIQSVRDSKQKVIQAKKDSIHVSAVGSESELADAVIKRLDAKKDFVDSVLSAGAEGIIHDKKEFGHSTCCASHTVENSFGAIHRNMGTASLNAKSRVGGSIHSNHQSGSINAQHKLHGTKLSSSVTTTHDKKSSLHSAGLSVTDDIAIGGKTESASSSSTNIHKSESSLNLEKNVQSSSQISGGLELGSIATKSKINSAEAGGIKIKTKTDGELDLGISISDGVSRESKISKSSNIEHASKIEVAKNIEIESSAGLGIGTHLGREDVVHSGLKSGIESAITSGISTELNTKHSAIVEGKSLLEGIREIGSIKSAEIHEAERADYSQSERKECASGQCGISGKLHVDLDTKSEIKFQKQTEIGTIFESEIHKNLAVNENNEEIIEANIQSPIDEYVSINTEIADRESKKHSSIDDKIDDFEAKEYEKSVEDVIERPIDIDDVHDRHSSIVQEEYQYTKPIITAGKEIKIDHGGISKFSVNHEAESLLDKQEEEGSGYIKEHESAGSNSEKEFGTKIVVQKQFEGKTGSIAFEKSIDSSIQSKISHHEEEGRNLGVDINSSYQVSGKIGDLESNSQSKYASSQSSTYETEFGKHYSNAAHRHEHASQNTGKISHLQCFDGSINAPLPEDVEQFRDDGTFSNGYCRLINLDVNCSGMTAFMKPECQQLNTNLWHAQDSGRPITLWTVKSYLNQGQELAIEMQNRANWLCDQGLVPKMHTAAMLHLINNWATENTVEINQESEFSLFGTKLLQRRFCSDFDATPNTFIEFLRHHVFKVIGTGLCHVRPKRCPADQMYRTFDGSCNNQEHPTWGKSNTAFARIAPARYHDGVHEPPKSVTGMELPNPRILSVHCFSRKRNAHRKITLAHAQWGQILSHDYAMQTIDRSVKGGIQCCADGKGQLPKHLQHHSCMPIDIPSDDKFYSRFGTRCMNFVRSITISREDCTLGPADQLNTVTSYLDVSPLYGSSKETCDQLRTFEGGRMRVAVRRGRELLPKTTDKSPHCDVRSPDEICYLAGDIRVNQNPQLAITQTLLLRRHNGRADELAKLNPHWNDERIFQEARKIVIAEYQCITHNEWLPLAIGKKYCRRHRLTPRRRDNLSPDYDPRIRASTINSFTTAAFRAFHSMVEGNINLCPANREVSHTLRLSNHFYRPEIIERNDNLDDLLRGLVSQPMQQSDKSFHPELTEYLFRSRNASGLDLEALDMARGRDHGLSCYNVLREVCGLQRAKDFDDLIREISQEDIDRLKLLYRHVDDIDLIVGIVLENKCSGAIIGPVGRCIIGEQFYRSKAGDRYFYSHSDQPHSFTPEQFEEIKKASLARLICDTGDNIAEIQPQAFKLISPKNPLVCCDALPKMDLSPWQESEYD